MARRTNGYTLYLDRAGLLTCEPLTDEIGVADTWTQLHWMAKAAAFFERAGRLWARDEACGIVLSMADMRQEAHPHVSWRTFSDEDLHTLRAADAVLKKYGFTSDLGTCIAAAEQANADEAPPCPMSDDLGNVPRP